MSKINQNDMEYLLDMVQRGELTADQANVEKVRMARVLVVTKLPADVRKALNDATKEGQLRHMKKDGRKPEVYFHPNFEHLANDARARYEKEMIEAIARVISRPYES